MHSSQLREGLQQRLQAGRKPTCSVARKPAKVLYMQQ
jgi:hypothetical protein